MISRRAFSSAICFLSRLTVFFLSASASFSAFISRSRCLIASCFLRCSSFFSHGIVFCFPARVLNDNMVQQAKSKESASCPICPPSLHRLTYTLVRLVGLTGSISLDESHILKNSISAMDPRSLLVLGPWSLVLGLWSLVVQRWMVGNTSTAFTGPTSLAFLLNFCGPDLALAASRSGIGGIPIEFPQGKNRLVSWPRLSRRFFELFSCDIGVSLLIASYMLD